MIQTVSLLPGVTLRIFRDTRFKQGCLSVQFLRPMCREEASLNALISAVLLRGCEAYPDLQRITWKLDDLYGAAIGTLARRIGDCQGMGLYLGFLEDRFALAGDQILQPMLELLEQLLLHPVTEGEGFCRAYVESEKKNLISTIESELNDKRAFAMGRLLKNMCREDSYGIPRLGDTQSVAAIDANHAYAHYRKILRESPVELFYVGSEETETVAAGLRNIFEKLERQPGCRPQTVPFQDGGETDETMQMEVAQAQLCMGFVTPITNRCEDHAAMQVANTLFGGGMTGKLFVNVREKMSLCYHIGSSYYGSKGILTVSAGIDADKAQIVREEVLRQLSACSNGDFTEEELRSAKEALLSGLRATHDSPGSIEGYYSTAAISGLGLTPAEYMEKIRAVTRKDAARAAGTVKLHSVFLLKGADQ